MYCILNFSNFQQNLNTGRTMSPRLLNIWSSSLMSKWCIGTCRICIYCIFHITRHPNVTHRGENYRCDRLNKYNDPLRSFELGFFFYDEAFKAYKADRGVCCVCSSCLCVSVLCAFFGFVRWFDITLPSIRSTVCSSHRWISGTTGDGTARANTPAARWWRY